LNIAEPELGQVWSARVHLEADTDQAGRFSFRGLLKEWSGFLRIPDGFMLVGAAHPSPLPSLPLKGPQKGLLLKLKTLPVLTGRVVAADRQTGVAGETISGSVRSDNGAGFGIGGITDKAGRFRISLVPGAWKRLELILTRNLARGFDLHLVRQGDFSQGGDLGNIVLVAARDVAFQAVDEEGHPLAGVVALGGKTFLWKESKPTGPNGRGVIRLPRNISTLWIGGLGRALVERQIPGDQELRVVLERAPLLRVLVKSQAGIKPSSLQVVIKAPARLMDHTNWAEREKVDHLTGGQSAAESTIVDGKRSMTVTPSKEGSVVIGGFSPDVPFVVGLTGGLATLDEVGPISLGPHGERKVVLNVPAVAGHLVAGTVLGPNAHPLEGAVVTLRSKQGFRVVETNDQGHFQVGPIFARQVELVVEAPGFAPLLIPDQLVGEASGELRLQLQRGHDVLVQVADAAGRPVAARSVSVNLGPLGRHAGQKGRTKGLFQLRDLPPGRFQVAAQVAGQTYTQMHDVTLPRCRLLVPPHGSVRVSWSADHKPPLDDLLLIFIPTEGGGRRLEKKVVINGPKWKAFIPAILPGDYTIKLFLRWSKTRTPGVPQAQGTCRIQAGQESEARLRD